MSAASSAMVSAALPEQRGVYYGGGWHEPLSAQFSPTWNPSTGESLGRVALSGTADVDAAVAAARSGFRAWSAVAPLERARVLREVAARLRSHAAELALIDAANCGNPVHEMTSDAAVGAAQIDFFAGLVTEMKGASIPMASRPSHPRHPWSARRAPSSP
jgi:betaine-aldehyde dehydrogenase